MRLSIRTGLSPAIRTRFEELFLSICHPKLRATLVEEYLTADERRDLGNRDDHTTDIVRVVAKRRHQSTERTVLELANICDLIGQLEYRRVCRAIGESPTRIQHEVSVAERKRDTEKPYWDRAKGELWFCGKRIRQIRMCKNPTNGQLILDAFEAAEWSSPIPHPLSGQLDLSAIHLANNYLNTGLSSIHFHIQRGGNEITWEAKPK